MLKDITAEQAFQWANRLTKPSDFGELTHEMVCILESLSDVQCVIVYEVYAGNQVQTAIGEDGTARIVRRFPVDFAKAESEDKYSRLLNNLSELKTVYVCEYQSENLVLLSVPDCIGPDRSILIKCKQPVSDSSISLFSCLLEIYANQVRLHDNKERDLLTRLPNRQSFDLRLFQVCEYFREHHLSDAMQDKGSWIAMLDIDHFKLVNDNFGHLYGDEVLLHFSQLMEKCFRYNDFLFRFGGEEFVVVLNLVNKVAAMMVFERFRQAVATFSFPTVGQVTVSIGVTHINTRALPASLLDHADKALYQAKETGRNQVIFYEDMDIAVVEEVEGDIELF